MKKTKKKFKFVGVMTLNKQTKDRYELRRGIDRAFNNTPSVPF